MNDNVVLYINKVSAEGRRLIIIQDICIIFSLIMLFYQLCVDNTAST